MEECARSALSEVARLYRDAGLDTKISGEKEQVHQRIWRIINKEQQHLLFLNSEHYSEFQRDHENKKVGYTVWADVLEQVNTFVTQSKEESCVPCWVS